MHNTTGMKRQDEIRILILDDEKHFTEELAEYFIQSGYIAFECHEVAEARKLMSKSLIDLIVLDVHLPGMNGLDYLVEVKSNYPETEVIIVSAHGDMDTVIQAMRKGAFDYLRKPFRHIDMQISLERSRKFFHLQQRLKTVQEKNSLISMALEQKINRQFIGTSRQIQDVLEAAVTASQYPEASVLITGESGTGKENIARIIHYMSDRKDHLFCPVNSSAITETLLDSEFFGHKRGSFTGATSDKMGFFEVSDGGTLFLDEIADMPNNLQSKILRALEEKVITRVGDTKPIHTNFRIISATNHDIKKLVEEKLFRLDLFHRLNTLHIHIPPLRERTEDIRPLLEYFVNYYSIKFNKSKFRIDEELIEALAYYDFPGNVRELKNMTERAMILCKGQTLGIEDFPVQIDMKYMGNRPAIFIDLKAKEADLIREVLRNSNYNQTATAELLGISRDALIRKMKKYEISISKSEV
jgi:DNA-binding NtrC family response regulator